MRTLFGSGVLPALFLAGACGCTSGAGGSGPAGPPQLRAGVQALESGSGVVRVRDIAGAGDHVAIVTSPDSLDVVVWLSDDRGRSFKRYPLPSLTELSRTYVFDINGYYGLGIHVTLDPTTKEPQYMLFVKATHNVEQWQFPYWLVMPLKLTDGVLVTQQPVMFGAVTPQGIEGAAVSYRIAFEERAGVTHSGDGEGQGHYEGFHYDVATRAVTQSPFVPFDVKVNPPCGGHDFSYQYRTTGDAFQAYCWDDKRVCLSNVFPFSGKEPNLVCFPRDQWPAKTAMATPGEGTLQLRTARGLLETYSDGGHAWATGIQPTSEDSGRIMGPFDLGPGRVVPDDGDGGVHHRFAPLVPVDVPGNDAPIDRLMLLPPAGPPREVAIPPTPCVNTTDCAAGLVNREAAYGEAEWVVSLGKDDYLVTYRLHSGYDDTIYASVEHDGNVPAAGVGHPASAVEATCEREAMCFPPGPDAVVGFNFDDCVNRWLSMHGASDEQDLALQAFLTTPPGDCDAFRGTDPQMKECRTGCVGSTAWSQCDPWAEMTNCAEHGLGACSMDSGTAQCTGGTSDFACDENKGAYTACDAHGNLVQCPTAAITNCAALGMTCTTGTGYGGFPAASCTRPATGTCTDPVTHCVGDESVGCLGGNEVPSQNCARAGLTCENGGCRGADIGTEECTSSTAPPACSGDKLTYCFQGTLRTIDCAAIGGKCGKPDQYLPPRCFSAP